MENIRLGKSELMVSRLCFGSLTMGPLQAGLSIDEGGELLAYAMKKGINVVDTAELYHTYPYVKRAIQLTGEKPIVFAKSYAYDKKGALESVELARREMDVDVIDCFMMHEQETRLTLKGHNEAFETYCELKQKGILKSVGVSTHAIEVVDAAADMPEMDIIHPIINMNGLGILDGSREQMLQAIEKAKLADKGILGMKALGGGNLLNNYRECFEWILRQPSIDCISVGMQTKDEIDMNCAMFSNCEIDKELEKRCAKRPVELHVADWCIGCGSCEERCQFDAIHVIAGRAVVDKDKCMTCGYCGGACRDFAIKIY